MEYNLEGSIPLPPTFLPSTSRWSSLFSFVSFRDSIQPWTDFLGPSQFQKPGSDSLARLRYNMKHFQANYLLMTLLIVCVYLCVLYSLSQPLLVLMLLGLAVVWSKVMTLELKEVLGREVTLTHKKWFMILVAAVLISYFASSLILSAVGVSASLVMAHALCHEVPKSELPLQYEPPQYQV